MVALFFQDSVGHGRNERLFSTKLFVPICARLFEDEEEISFKHVIVVGFFTYFDSLVYRNPHGPHCVSQKDYNCSI